MQHNGEGFAPSLLFVHPRRLRQLDAVATQSTPIDTVFWRRDIGRMAESPCGLETSRAILGGNPAQ